MKKIIRPRSIRLEASTICQLKCSSCPTASGEVGKSLGLGYLKFSDFKNVVDNNDWISSIELSNWGEIFFNKDLVQIIHYAYKRNVALQASNGVNLNNVSEETLEALVKYRFRHICCSIDGASQQTYSQYRCNGNFQKVIKNIKTINKFKRKYHSQYPQLYWQFIIFGHNEHEICQARVMANELNMEFSTKLSWDDLYSDNFSPIRDSDLVRRETGLGVATREEYWQTYNRLYTVENCCLELWKQPQINYDGRLLGCCINYWSDYGNVFQEGLEESINNERINYVRDMLMGQHTSAEGTPCLKCNVYKKRKENNHWIKGDNIKESYAPRRTYILFENKILGVRLTKRTRSTVRYMGRLRKRNYKKSFESQRIQSGVYSLRIPLPKDKNGFWFPFHLFKGVTKGVSEFSCHASVLLPGRCPHTPHRHREEELLLMLSGQADIILPDVKDQMGKIYRRLIPGEFVYYPQNFAHTIKTSGESLANYLMFKWRKHRRDKGDALPFGCFNMIPSVVDQGFDNGFHTYRIFMGHTEYLSKLECHFSMLTSKAGYDPHTDNYDVAIVVLEGQVETLGQLASPYDVIFYAAGEPHGIYNPGEGTAKYLVFEFHPLKNPFLKWIIR